MSLPATHTFVRRRKSLMVKTLSKNLQSLVILIIIPILGSVLLISHMELNITVNLIMKTTLLKSSIMNRFILGYIILNDVFSSTDLFYSVLLNVLYLPLVVQVSFEAVSGNFCV